MNFNRVRSRPKSADPRPKSLNKSASFIKKKTSIACELNRNDIPPLCDYEHTTGDCYCYLCTCGQHQCPGEYKRKIITTRSHFSTSYNHDFKKLHQKVEIGTPMPEFRPAHFPLDSETTTKKDYPRHRIVSTKASTPQKSDYTSLKFVGKTNYTSTFNVWNEKVQEKTYNMEIPVQLPKSKFISNSCYRENFKIYSAEPFNESSSFAQKNREKARGCTGILSASSDFLGKSSQKSDYQKEQCTKFTMGKGTDPTLCPADWRSNFQTTYKESFINPVFKRLVKKKYLISKS